MVLDESLNFSEQHLPASLQNRRTIQAHGPQHSETQKLGIKMHLAANTIQADILCTISIPFTAESGLVLPLTIGSLSLKLQNSEFLIAADPQFHEGLRFCPTCTRLAMGIKCNNTGGV